MARADVAPARQVSRWVPPVGVIACDYKFSLKKELHARFAKWHKGNDWFDPVPELRISISTETHGHACNECMSPSAAEDQALQEKVNSAVAEAFGNVSE